MHKPSDSLNIIVLITLWYFIQLDLISIR